MRRHISGSEASYVAIESDKRGPVQLEPLPEDGAASALSTTTGSAALAPAIPEASAPRKVTRTIQQRQFELFIQRNLKAFVVNGAHPSRRDRCEFWCCLLLPSA